MWNLCNMLKYLQNFGDTLQGCFRYLRFDQTIWLKYSIKNVSDSIEHSFGPLLNGIIQ